MKNILLASTALVVFAGAAAADVSITGRAEMGIFSADKLADGTFSGSIYTPGVVTSGNTQFFTDIDVTFTMSGETDNGLTFGASVDLDEGGAGAAAVADNADDGGATIFISGGFGTLTMGDTDGALDWAITDIGNIRNGGSIADDETAHAAYIGNGIDGRYDGQILRYDYSFGDFGVAVSIEQDDTDTVDDGFAIGVKYSMDMGGVGIDFGLGYQEASIRTGISSGVFAGLTTGDDLSVIGMSVVGNFGDFSAGLNYAEIRSDLQPLADGDYMGFGVGYSANGLTVHANYAELDVLYAPTDREGYGLSVAYDLGGGAVVHGGYGSGSVGGSADAASWSLGLGLSF
jgi:outer membrane protein OmpU